jgi:beta-lactamase superfamily II metal-dependent hydrolase
MQDLARTGEALAAAHALDDMINSTSLVIVLQIGSAKLVLTGDAEWSTWKGILANEGARLLLRGTTFLKVSHHGSHNGTPKTLVDEVLGERVSAMVSTQAGPEKYRSNIPLPALIQALEAQRVRVVRSDGPIAALPDGYTADDQGRWIDLLMSVDA